MISWVVQNDAWCCYCRALSICQTNDAILHLRLLSPMGPQVVSLERNKRSSNLAMFSRHDKPKKGMWLQKLHTSKDPPHWGSKKTQSSFKTWQDRERIGQIRTIMSCSLCHSGCPQEAKPLFCHDKLFTITQ